MRVLYSLICEKAEARDDGRLDVEGIFHQLYAPGFPAQQDELVLVTVLEWDAGEEGEIDFQIRLIGPNQQALFSAEVQTVVGRGQESQQPLQTRILLPLRQVVFPNEGAYHFQLELDGATIPLIPLHLLVIQEPVSSD